MTVRESDVLCTITNTPTPPLVPPVVVSDSYGVDLIKVNDADGNGDFGNFENAVSEGNPVEFQVSIENTGTGTLAVTSLLDSFAGTTVNLLTNPTFSCLRDGGAVTLAASLPGGSTTVCTFTLDNYAPAAGEFLTNTATVVTDHGQASDNSTVTTPAVLPDEVLPSSITIVKAVEGSVPDGGWEFGFSGDLGTFTLSNDDSSNSHGSLFAGEYTITEDDSTVADLTGIDCGSADVTRDGSSVTIDLAEGEDVSCTFTNTFKAPTVLPDVQERPQTLPRTGSGTRNLAGIGLALIALGAVLMAGSRRRYGVID